MKTNTPTQRRRSGFTLIEMIGVLAIIAVLAALLIPRIFTAINESRVNGAALSYNSAKSAAMSYFGKFGRFGATDGTAYNAQEITDGTNWGAVLLASGFTEKPFETKIATASSVNMAAAVSAATAVTSSNTAYDLDGSGTTANDAAGQLVIQAVLTGVALDDAQELSAKIDGPALSQADNAITADLAGRVKYGAGSGGVTDVYLYIAHK